MKTLIKSVNKNYEFVSSEYDDLKKCTEVVKKPGYDDIYESIYDYNLDTDIGFKTTICNRLFNGDNIANSKKIATFPKNLLMREEHHGNLHKGKMDRVIKYTIVNGKSYIASVYEKNWDNNFTKDHRQYDKNGNIKFRKVRNRNIIKIYHCIYDSDNKPIEIIEENTILITGEITVTKYLYSYEYYEDGSSIKTINKKMINESNKLIYDHCSYNYDEHGYLVSIINHKNNKANIYIEYIDSLFDNNFNYDIEKFFRYNVFLNICKEHISIDDKLNIIPKPNKTKYVSRVIGTNNNSIFNYTITKEGYYLITHDESHILENSKIIKMHYESSYDKNNNLVLDKYESEDVYSEKRISYDDLNRCICKSRYEMKYNESKLTRKYLSLFKYESDYSDEYTSNLIIITSAHSINNIIRENHISYDESGRIIENIDNEYLYDDENDVSEIINKFIEGTDIVIK